MISKATVAINFDAVKPIEPPEPTPATPEEDLTGGLGAALRDMRELKKMTRNDVAEKSGISANYLASIEAGRAKLTVMHLFSYVAALGVDMQISFADRPPELPASAMGRLADPALEQAVAQVHATLGNPAIG